LSAGCQVGWCRLRADGGWLLPCQTFATISKAGVPISQGLRVISRAIANECMAKQLNTMLHSIERGCGIAHTARASGVFLLLWDLSSVAN